MGKVKKIINDPENIVPEVIDGLVLASHGKLKKVDGVNALMRTRHASRQGCAAHRRRLRT